MGENVKRLNGRIINKHDIESNWIKATNFTPMLGELIIYDVDDSHDYERMKIGDGVTNVNDLPFVSTHPDFNENNENAAEYIHNRTHYKYVEESVYVPNNTYEGIIKTYTSDDLAGEKFCLIDLSEYERLFDLTADFPFISTA